MILIGDRLDSLRADMRGDRARQWKRLYEQCDWYRTQHPPSEHPTASITYFGPAAANLALAYVLSGQRGYLDEAWRWISTCIGYPHWGKANLPDHDLDAGWLLHGLSLAYSWLAEDLEPAQEAALREKLTLQGERLHKFAIESEGTWWSSSFWQNHNWICYTGLATAGYALNRPEWTERARANFARVLELMPSDGSDSEGVVYWRYGVPWLAIYTDLLHHEEGIDWWGRGSFLRNTFHWRLHQCAPGFEENVDHGDCHDRRSGHSVALYYKLASAYRIGEAQWLADKVSEEFFWREAYASGVKPGVMPESFLEYLWFDPSVVAVDPVTSVPTTAYFPDLGQVTARTGWDSLATFASFKAAPGGGHGAWETARRFYEVYGWETLNAGHHHPDSGAFVLASHGAFLVVDDGYSNRKRAGDHNLVLVDGQGWADENRYHVYKGIPWERLCRVRDALASDGFVHATSETAAMFDEALEVRRLDRTFVMTPTGRIVLLDLVESAVRRTWTLLLHSDWPASLMGSHGVVLRSGPGAAVVTALGDSLPEISRTTTEIEANPTASTPSLRIAKTVHTVRMDSAGHLFTAIEPVDSFEVRQDACRIDCASGWGVRFGSFESVYLSPIEGRIDAPDVTADALAVLRSGDRTAVVGGTKVVVDGRVVLDSARPVTGIV